MPTANPFDQLDDGRSEDESLGVFGRLDNVPESVPAPRRESVPLRTNTVLLFVVCVLIASAFAIWRGSSGAYDLGLSGSSALSETRIYPRTVAVSDIATDHDSRYLEHRNQLLQGGPLAKVGPIRKLRDLIYGFGDQTILAWHLKDALPVAGQNRFSDLNEQVRQCANILDIDAPRVWVKQDVQPNAYVTGFNAPRELVVTSGLLELYQDFPDELRFVIGHEMGHIKCNHVKAHCVVRYLFAVIAGKGDSLRTQILAPLLSLEFLHWCRASEMSADRAGLICVGQMPSNARYNEEVAKQALLRLLHGTQQSVDSDKLFETLRELERDNRLAEILALFQGLGRSHPFITDRCEAVQSWARSDEYQLLLKRE